MIRNELSQDYLDALMLLGYAMRLKANGFPPRVSAGDAERLFKIMPAVRFDEAAERLIEERYAVATSYRSCGKRPHTIELRLDMMYTRY